MTPEENIEHHEQWLRAMESNQMQFAADLAAAERERKASEHRFERQINQITGILEQVVRHQAVLSAKIETVGQHLDRLEALVEQYIRYRGDGKQTN